MATRSTIAVQHADGTVSQIYSHWDGYLDHNGQLLQSFYNSQELAEALVSLGDISSLNERRDPLGTTHSFDSPEKDVTIYYGRDRGEDGCAPSRFADVAEYFKAEAWQEYDYLFINGEWLVRYDGADFIQLATALTAVEE